MHDEDPQVIRKRLRSNLLWNLFPLADIELQRERWLNKEITTPRWSYVEFMCMYFDDSNARDGDWLIKEGILTKAEFDCISDFNAALKLYRPPTDRYDHQAILNDPEWQRVVAIGAVAVRFLQALLLDPEEKEILSKRLYARLLTASDFSWPKRPS